jgi:predicted dehydrogenase
VGHTFLYSAPVLKTREIIQSGELGDIFYISSVRANLGLFQHDVNVAWDLATHDISIILWLLDRGRKR